MKRFRFLGRLTRGRRPPTGPLTTSEATEAEERQETQTKDDRQVERDKGAGGSK
jgi:hypothetical protein